MLSLPGQKLGGRCASDPCLHALITRKQGCARLPARESCSYQLVGKGVCGVRAGLAAQKQDLRKISVMASAAIKPLHAVRGQSHSDIPTSCWGAAVATQSTGRRSIMIPPAVHQQSSLASRCISISTSSQSRPWRSLLARANMADTLVKETISEDAQGSPLSVKPTTPTIPTCDDTITTTPLNPSTSSLPEDTAEISDASKEAFPIPLQSTEPVAATDNASDTPIQSLPVLAETISTTPACLHGCTTEPSDIPQTNPSIPPQSAEPVAAFDGAGDAPLLIQSLPVLTDTSTPAPSPEPAVPTFPIIDIPRTSSTPTTSESTNSQTTAGTVAPVELTTLTDTLSIASTAVQETEIASIEVSLATIQLDVTNTMTPASDLPSEESVPVIDPSPAASLPVQPPPSLSVASLPPSSDSSHQLQAPSSISSGNPLSSNIKTLTIELENSIPTITSRPMESTISTLPVQETHTTSTELSTPHDIDAVSTSTSSLVSDAEEISPAVNASPTISLLASPPQNSQPEVEFPSSPLTASLPLPSETLDISFTPSSTEETYSAVLPEVEIISSVLPEAETTSSPLLSTAPPSLNSSLLQESPSDVSPPPAIAPAVFNVIASQSLAPSTPSILPSEVQTPTSISIPSPLQPYDSPPDQVPSDFSGGVEERTRQSDVESSSPSFLDHAKPSPDTSLNQIPSDSPPPVAIARGVVDGTPSLPLLDASASVSHSEEETTSLPVAPSETSSTESTVSILEATSSPSLSSPTASLDASPTQAPTDISPPPEAPPVADASPLLSIVDATTSLSIPKVDSSLSSTPSDISATPATAPDALAPLSSFQVATPGRDPETAPSPVMVIASLPADAPMLDKPALNIPPAPSPLEETAPVIWLDTQTKPPPASLPAASSLPEQQLIPELISPPALALELDTSVATISQPAAESSLSTIAVQETHTPSTELSQDAISTSTLTPIAAEVEDSPPILPLLPYATSSPIPEADPPSIPLLEPPPPPPEPFLQQATSCIPAAVEISALDVAIKTPASDTPSPVLAASELPLSDSILYEQAPSDIAPTPPSLPEETAPVLWLSNQTTADLSIPPSPPATPEQPPLSKPLSLDSETLTLQPEQPKADDSISAEDTTLSSPPVPEATIAPTESAPPSEPDTITTPTAAADLSTEAIATAVEAPPKLEEVQSLPPPDTDTLLPSPKSPIHQAASDFSPAPSPVEETAPVSLLLSSSLPPPPPPLEQQPLPETTTISKSPAPETPAIALKELLDLPEAHRITAVVDPEVEVNSGSTTVTSIQQSSLIPLARDSDQDTTEKGRPPPLTPRAPVMVTAQVTNIESSLLAAADPTLGPHLFPALFLSMAVTASFLSLSSWNAKQGMLELVIDKNNPFHKEIIARCPLLNSHYDPIPLLTGRHTSTIFAAFFRSLPNISFRRDCLRMPDGGTVALDWPANGADWEPFQNKTLPEDAPLLILLPGLTGGSDDTYVRHLLIRVRKHGWKTVVFNSRGCADSPVTTPQFYSASFTEDLREVVKHVASLHPSSRLYAAGWSLGANILVRYLGQEKGETPLAGAVSLCNPFDLVEADKEFHIGFNNVYNRNLAKGLNRIFKKHATLFEGLPPPYNIELVANAKTVREFDDGLTRVSFGYPTVDHYYSDASSAKSIPDVAIPLLCVQAEDDPIAPSVGIPREAIAENGNVILVVTPGGGHLGWVAGDDAPFGAPWTDPLVIEYLEAIEALAATKPPGFKVAHEDAGKAQVIETTTHESKGDGNGSVREGDKSVPISW